MSCHLFSHIKKSNMFLIYHEKMHKYWNIHQKLNGKTFRIFFPLKLLKASIIWLGYIAYARNVVKYPIAIIHNGIRWWAPSNPSVLYRTVMVEGFQNALIWIHVTLPWGIDALAIPKQNEFIYNCILHIKIKTFLKQFYS